MSAWFAEPNNLRGTAFLGGLLLLLALEVFWPRRHGPMFRRLRWPANLGMVITSSALVIALPLATLSAALWARREDIGLFNRLDAPPWIEGLLCWLALDCAIYAQHRLMHAYPLLWRLHRVHHSDIELDATTALRFHPLEIVLSVLWKILLIVLLGAAPLAVLIFEITLNGAAMFNHANLNLAGDRWLRRIVVTPDMHRVHHSLHRAERDSNYGFSISLWDHLFRSYTAQPQDGHATMKIGLTELRAEKNQGLIPLLMQPAARL